MRVLAHFVAHPLDGGRHLAYLPSPDWLLDVTHLVASRTRVQDPRVASLEGGTVVVGREPGVTSVEVGLGACLLRGGGNAGGRRGVLGGVGGCRDGDRGLEGVLGVEGSWGVQGVKGGARAGEMEIGGWKGSWGEREGGGGLEGVLGAEERWGGCRGWREEGGGAGRGPRGS